MRVEDIRIMDKPENIVDWVSGAVMLTDDYRASLGKDLLELDEVNEICRMAQFALVDRGLLLEEELRNLTTMDCEARRHVQRALEQWREDLNAVLQCDSFLDVAKRDVARAVSCVISILDDLKTAQGNVDTIMGYISETQ